MKLIDECHNVRYGDGWKGKEVWSESEVGRRKKICPLKDGKSGVACVQPLP